MSTYRTLFCFLFGAVIVWNGCCANPEALRMFNTAFGQGRVESAFDSAASMDSAFEHEYANIQGATTMESALRPRFGCASYRDGQEIAREHDAGDNSMLAPFYVDREEDLMCFLVRGHDQQDTAIGAISHSKFRMLYYIPAVLKVEPIVFDTVDALLYSASGLRLNEELPSTRILSQAGVQPFDITITWWNSYVTTKKPLEFSVTPDVEQASTERLSQRIKRLKRYDTPPLEDLFWTSHSSSQSARGEYRRKPRTAGVEASSTASTTGTGRDQTRTAAWYSLMDTLTSATKRSTLSDDTPDPCSYTALDVRLADSHIDISISHLLVAVNKTIGAACLSHLISSLVTDPAVINIGISTRPQLLNYRARSIQQSGRVGFNRGTGSTPFTDLGLAGQGQVVAVSDTGLDEKSCYFYDWRGQVARSQTSNPVTDSSRRKVVQYTYLPQSDVYDKPDGHGTHVCGTVAGYNNADLYGDGKFSGVAPGAKLAFMDLAGSSSGLSVPPVNTLYGVPYTAGARIYTNSWGSVSQGYSSYSGYDTDKYLYDHHDIAIFFAAGNSGWQGDKTITMQGAAKNVIAVGSGESTLSSDSIDNVAYYSSIGYAYDGRIKPDIIAPGASLLSAQSQGNAGLSCSTVGKSGTSMASPSAAGAAALIRQYFMDANYYATTAEITAASGMDAPEELANQVLANAFVPSGVLVKAVILHAGTKMSRYHKDGHNDIILGNPPDQYQGYGRINLGDVLPLKGYNKVNLFVRDLERIYENSKMKYEAYVQDTSIPFKVTMSWYDPPPVGSPAKALINDLDIRVISPSRVRYYGNGKSTYDTVNNNEQIFIKNPEAGRWQIAVFSNALPYAGSQLYSIVITCGGTIFQDYTFEGKSLEQEASVLITPGGTTVSGPEAKDKTSSPTVLRQFD